jgi:hypothetical protein
MNQALYAHMNNERKMKKKENVVFIHDGILYSHEEKQNVVICM